MVLDTNVLVSGIFFGGVPGQIVDAWSDDRLAFVLTPEILEEYARVGHTMAAKYPDGRKAFTAMLEILMVHSPVLAAAPLPAPVSADPDDDKFLAAAVAAGVQVVISGDRHLLDVSGWQDVEVVTPRAFVRQHLPDTDS
ncbi:MAG: putative toxin-antitoxin system toxin component, PIN family [Gemmatimonadales bacterium]|nr:putative toxin-antitoxin system toxin component, PIN family [Gemmatimonadales bacterium]